MANIKFGTDGWRAVVGKDFTEENVLIATRAIAKYIFETFGLTKKILIGYDPRNMAEEFGSLCAEELAKKGFTVLLSDKIIPTPVLAYNAKYYNACAIMFTASHNPPEYLGLKFIPDYAGPATDDITKKITSYLGSDIENNNNGKFETIDFSENYFSQIKNIIDFDKIKAIDKNIIFDGLHSATIGYFDKLLDEFGIKYSSINMNHDKNFDGKMPEPKPPYIDDLIEKVKSSQNAIGFANDGDGDRFGVIDETGNWILPDEIIAMLMMHLKNNKNQDGVLVKTVGSSNLLNKIAQLTDVKVVETAVGFKHVGSAMREFKTLIGGEDSGGLSTGFHIPEKDGILANLLILEMLAYENKPLSKMLEDLYALAGKKYVKDRIDLKLESDSTTKQILESFKQTETVEDLTVKSKNQKDGVKLVFTNESWILVRPSGTEPLLRIYIEAESREQIKSMKEKIEKFYNKVLLG
ncbi:phosphoglucomutase/phosphomannomutase family protein [bacterium]|nr:phosphoglucomutase/phosphomannomutase family protein [bacterium]